MLYADDNSQKVSGRNRLWDLFLTAAAFIAAYFIRLHLAELSTGPSYYVVLLAVLVGSLISYDFFDLHNWNKRKSNTRLIVEVIKGAAAGLVISLFILYMLRIGNVSRGMLAIFLFLDIVFLLGWRYLYRYFFAGMSRSDSSAMRIVIVGSKSRARDLVDYLLADKAADIRILGYLDTTENADAMEKECGVPYLGPLDSYAQLVHREAIDEVIFAMPLRQIDAVDEKISLTETLGIGIRILPDWQIQKIMYRPEVAGIRIESLFGVPTLTLSSAPAKESDLFIKNMIDRAVAFSGLMVLLPALCIIAVLIRLSSPGPVFFRQQRSGRNGRLFTMYKFRTMVVNAEQLRADLAESNEMDGPVFKIARDPRITPIGQFLRKTSMDELPQLFNILRGDMSLVGPRPPLPDEVAEYKPWQRRRLSMKPGITCIWQVSGRNNIGFEQWMEMDLEYIDNWSLLLDMKLLFKTIPAVIKGTGS